MGRHDATARRITGPAESLRQAMAWLHTWAGLIFGWILFAMFLTGTLAFFRPEITHWMQPETPARPDTVSAARAADVAQQYLQQHAAGAARWFITLPTAREPLLGLGYQVPRPAPGERGFKRVRLDPATGQVVQARETRGGDFFYRFHFELEMAHPWGRWLASVAGMFMLVAIISGVITHKKIFADFFTFRPRKGGQRAWMDGHNALSVLGLPFHLMITFSGLVIFMAMLLPAGIAAVYENPRAFTDDMFPAFAAARASEASAPLVDLGSLVARAQAEWRGGEAGQLVVAQPGKQGAVVSISRASGERITYARSAPSLRYDGNDGRLLARHDADSAARITAGTLIGLHLGLFAEPLLRWLYFLVSLAGTAMVGTGLALWVAKRRQKAGGATPQAFSLRLVDALNAGTIAGLCVAVAAYFWANRLLPAGLAGRAAWETRAFFLAWALCFIYAFLKPARRWPDLLALAAGLAALLPAVNGMTTARHLGVSLPAGDWIMAGFDLAALAAAGLLAWMWRKARPLRQRAAPRAALRPARHPSTRTGVSP